MKNYTRQAKEVIKRSAMVEENQNRLDEIVARSEQAKNERAQEHQERLENMVEKTERLTEEYIASGHNAEDSEKEKAEAFDAKVLKYLNHYYGKQYNKNMKKLILNEEPNSKSIKNKLLVETAKVKDAEESQEYYAEKTKQYAKLNEVRKPIWNSAKPVTTIGFGAVGTFASMAGYILEGGVTVDSIPVETAVNAMAVGLAGTIVGGILGNSMLSTKVNDRAHRLVQAISERKVEKHRAKANSIREFNISKPDRLAEEFLSGSALEKYKAKKQSEEQEKPALNDVRTEESVISQREDNIIDQREDHIIETPIVENEDNQEIEFDPEGYKGIRGEDFLNGVEIEAESSEMGE